MGSLAIIANRTLENLFASGPLPSWAGLLVAPGVIGFCAIFEWVGRVRNTIPSGVLKTRFGDTIIRVAQALALLYGYNSLLYPEMRLRDFYGGLAGPALWSGEVMALFVAPLTLAMLLWALSIVLCLNRDPEPAERVRLVAFLIGIPMIASGLIVPLGMAATFAVVGITVILGGALRHAELRGRQGQFLGRFLSPQVAALANREGLRAAMREERRELSIVCTDLRGFTAYAGAHDSSVVIQLLREYYDAVGRVVLEFEGTIKDYAGDGVLILLGAPVAVPDHAVRALAMARRIGVEVESVIAPFRGNPQPLGLGIGIASGTVTVGFVGGEGPLEYAAVGPAVNLAARMCDHAASREILIAEETRMLLGCAGDGLVRSDTPLSLKGFTEPVSVYIGTQAAEKK
jgi:class 3 adenylate cyclase